MLQDEVTAGPLRIDLRELETRSIWAAGVELVRGVYFAVRDPAWGTVQPDVLTRAFEPCDGGFVLNARCRYHADPLSLEAQIAIRASGDGLLRYESTAIARSAFSYNRIGFCVLHPPAELDGATLCLDGAEEVELTGRILPQLRTGSLLAPAAGPFSSLTVSGASGARVEFRFDGDRFELEDQRNWTDGSFKTYGTPLASGPPSPLETGTELTQSVEIRLVEPPRRRRSPAPAIPELTLAGEALAPRIGFAAGAATVPGELAPLVRPAHLRVDLRDGRTAVERVVELAAELECGVQLGLHLPLSDEERNDLHHFPGGSVPTSVLVLHRDAERLTAKADAEELRLLLGERGRRARFWTGTDAYYAQLNRGLRTELGGDLTFSIHPQVHATDEQSLIETLEIQRDVVLDLRAKQPGCHVSLGAVTLGSRRNFSAPPGVAVDTPAPDSRQSSLFGAVWSLASVRYLSEADVDEASYHVLTGAGGLIDEAGHATPLFHLFADLAELGGQTALVDSTAPLRCAGLAFPTPASFTLLVGNLRAEPLRARLPFAHGQLRRLKTDTIALATEEPGSFRESREAWRGEILELEPNEYVRMEVTA
jgi:hypothetical protein